MKTRLILSVLLIALLAWPALAGPTAIPFDGSAIDPTIETLPTYRAPGDPVDFAAALAAGATYLQVMQADITDDNAGNGWNGVNETPDDPDDGGWDWVVNLSAPLHHTTAASATNIYGATGQGLLAAYEAGGGGGYFTALTDAATAIVAAGTAAIRTSSDMIFLMEYDDLPAVGGTTYADAARAKYDARIATYGSATAFAVYVRDTRGIAQGLPNGIIGWDLGAYAKAAAMLDTRYPGNGYDLDADAIAEVLWQDSFNGSPGLFDIIADAGWDPTGADVNFWWYTLGLTGLIDAFHASGTHTGEIAGLIDRLEDSTFSSGAVSGSYGANATDEDWQSTAYTAMSLAYYDQVGHQGHINRLAYWIGATQDASGAWAYSNGNHYPEVGGENTAALALGKSPSTVLVDDDFLSQAEVDAYNAAHSTSYVFGYDAFASIQDGIDAVSGSTVHVAAGIYEEQLNIDKPVEIAGAGRTLTTVLSPVTLTDYYTTSANNYPVIYIHDTDGVSIHDLTVDGAGRGNANYRFFGVAFYNAGGTLEDCDVLRIEDTPFSGSQHGNAIYAWNDVAPAHTVNVVNCAVSDFQKNGITMNGSRCTAHIEGCTVTGKGATPITAQNGIQLAYGVTASVVGTSATGLNFTGSGWAAAGILIYQSPSVTLSGDWTATDNYVGILCEDSNADISGGFISNQHPDSWDGIYARNFGNRSSSEDARGSASPAEETGSYQPGRANQSVSISGVTIDGHDRPESWGINLYAASEQLDVEIQNVQVTDFDIGIRAVENGGTVISSTDQSVIASNGMHGFYASGPTTQVATGNWWGHVTGPYHATSNAGGLANPVSDFVDFDPWLGGNVAFSPDPQVINLDDAPGYAGEVVLNYLGGGSGLVYGYSIDIVWDPLVITSVVVGLPDTGPFAIAPVVGSTPITNGRRFDAALGDTSDGTSMAPLLKVTYVANGTLDDAESPLTLTLNYFRDYANQPLSGFVGDNGLVIVDLVAPSVTGVAIVNDTVSPVTGSNDFVKDTDALTVTATVSDGGALTAADIKADLSDFGGGAAVTPASYIADLATWSIASAACTPADGALSVVVTVTDPSNNVTTASDGITADNTLPTVVSGLVVTPGHNEVNAVWNDASGNDLNYYRTLLMTTSWGNYPHYVTAPPAYPAVGALPAAWSGTGATTTLAYAADGSARDIVYVGAFVVDMALNFSVADPGGQDRATNYWLGDVYPDGAPLGDGYVEALDVSQLGASYGLAEGAGGFNAHCDVGPTDDYSGLGIPQPDDLVGFEDLMIFSLNYGDVAPLPLAQGSEFAQLEWLQTEDGNWSLVLAEPCANLKALHLTAALPAGVKAELIPGSMLEQQAGAVFLRQIPGQELDVSLAIMGTDAVLLGEGALFSVRLPAGALPGTPVIVARDRLNQPLDLDLESTDAAELPTVYRLAGNFPNPFNPKTLISFDLPQSQFVKLEVFGTDGRRIATLLDEQMAAGHHSAVWTGRDDSGSPVASGVYFARIAAGPLQETHKMLLMK